MTKSRCVPSARRETVWKERARGVGRRRRTSSGSKPPELLNFLCRASPLFTVVPSRLFQMSLFLGNLSATIRREEIEREFGRFGMCHIKMKNGYGFAVYEVPEDAERALRTLCGRNICGQQISLSWSNRQPKYFRKFSRNNRFHEQYPGRNNREGFVNARYQNTYNQNHFVRQSTNNRRVSNLVSVQDRKVDHSAENIENLREEYKQNTTEAVPNEIFSHESQDRWDGAVTDTLGESGVKNDAMFERYKPQNDFDGEDILRNLRESDSNGSPVQVSLMDKGVREQSNDAHVNQIETTKQKPLCDNCGLLGHMMDKCPRETAIRLERFGRLDDRHNVDHAGGSRVSGSENVKRHVRRDKFMQSKGSHQPKGRVEHQGRKRRKHGDGPLNKRDGKRRRSSSSSSNGSSSSSQLRASRSSSNISSYPCSKSYNSHSRSTRSRSASVTSNPKSKISCLKSISSVDESQSISSDVKLSPMKTTDVSTTKCIFPVDHEDNFAKPNTGKSSSADFEVTETNHALEVEITDPSFNTGHIILHNKNQGDDEHTNCFSSKNMGVEEEDMFLAPLNKIPLTSTKLSENIKKKYEHGKSSHSNSSRHLGGGSENYTDEATKISPKETHMGSKHYGLTMPEGPEQEFSLETYFGASRLWPWEIIYYRRLKKGPISTENYARRVAQNKEFGIVDKYIRSSTGWGERYGSSR